MNETQLIFNVVILQILLAIYIGVVGEELAREVVEKANEFLTVVADEYGFGQAGDYPWKN